MNLIKTVKNSRTRCLLIAAFIMLMALTPVMAAGTSTVTFVKGSSGTLTGTTQKLTGGDLVGDIYSTSSSTGSSTQYLYGYMKTKGILFTVTRDSAKVSPRSADMMVWINSENETGTFWAEGKSPDGNHYGVIEVWEE